MARLVERSKEPKPTDGLYRTARIEYTDGELRLFEARYDVAERWWLCPDGTILWPTSWDKNPLDPQPITIVYGD